MIDHVTIWVSDLEQSKLFYEKAFAPLGYKVSFGEEDGFWAFKLTNGALFEIAQCPEDEVINPVHIAFRVKSKEAVHEFHKAALAAGGKDNGAPGPRPQYSEDYYACFVLDPDEHNIEAMLYVK